MFEGGLKFGGILSGKIRGLFCLWGKEGEDDEEEEGFCDSVGVFD